MFSGFFLNIIIVKWLDLLGMFKFGFINKFGVVIFNDRGVGRYFILEWWIFLIMEWKWDVYWIWFEIKIIIIFIFSVMLIFWLYYKM